MGPLPKEGPSLPTEDHHRSLRSSEEACAGTCLSGPGTLSFSLSMCFSLFLSSSPSSIDHTGKPELSIPSRMSMFGVASCESRTVPN